MLREWVKYERDFFIMCIAFFQDVNSSYPEEECESPYSFFGLFVDFFLLLFSPN